MTHLKGMTWDHPRGYDCLVAASKTYETQTGVSIEWSKRSLQAFADHPIEDLARDYDFIVLDHPHVGQIAETGVLAPLPAQTKSGDSLGGSAESYFWNGKYWALAIDAACQMAVRRPDIDAPQPKHWEEFLASDAKKFKALTPLLPVDAFDMLLSIVAGRGEADLPYSTQNFVSDENGIYALDIIKALYKLGPAEAANMNPIAVLEALSTSNEFACSPCLFGYVNYARPGFRDHTLEYFDLPLCQNQPLPRGILGGAGIGVSAQTKAMDAAIKFAQWVTSESVQSGVYLQNEGQPANRHTWLAKKNDPQYKGFFQGGFHTIDNAWTRPRDTWFLGFVDDACEIMPDFFRKDLTSQECLKRLNTAYSHHTKGI